LLYLAGLELGNAMDNQSLSVGTRLSKFLKLPKGELKKMIIQDLEEVANDKICASCAAEYWLQPFLSEYLICFFSLILGYNMNP